MDSWERFNETSLPPKESFYSEFNLENIIDKDYLQAQKGEYHDLYVQTDTSLLADAFEKFRDKCIEIYGLDPSHFFICTRISMASMLKKNINLELLTYVDMLLMIEAGSRGGMCQSTRGYAEANNKYMKNYDESTESSYLMYLDVNNLYGWAIPKKLPVNGFKCENDLSKFKGNFKKL